MYMRLLTGPDGRLIPSRTFLAFAITMVLALFGTLLIALAPTLFESDFARGAWVMFATVILKFPLITLAWALIRRNTEWPGHPVVWDDDEVSEILGRLEQEANTAARNPGAPKVLEALSREAWEISDSVSPHRRVDALTVTLKIDQLRMIAERNDTPPQPLRRGGR